MTRETADGYRSNLNNPTTLRELQGIDTATLVVCGGRTTETFRRLCSILRDRLPRCTALDLAGAAHMSPLTHPDQVADAIHTHVAGTRASVEVDRLTETCDAA